MTFTVLFDTFKGFFSRGFWFANFLPILLAAALHGLLAALVFDWNAVAWLTTAISATPGTAIVLFAGIVVLAYALAPLTPLLGSLLDGSLLPAALHDALRADRAAGWRKENTEWRAAIEADAGAKGAAGSIAADLRAAIARSTDQKTAEDPDFHTKQTAIDAADKQKNKIDALPWDKARQPSRPVELKDIKALATHVVAALERKTPPLVPANGVAIDSLKASRKTLTKLLQEHRTNAEQNLRAISARLEIYDPLTWHATRLAEVRHALRRHVRDHYNVEFGWLWPRVRMTLIEGQEANSTGVPRQIADTAAQVDFSIALLGTVATVPLVWLPLIVAEGGPIRVFLGLAVTTPLVLRLLYELVVRSEMALGDTIRTAIDRNRLSVFKMLSMPLPATLSAERELWNKLGRAHIPDAGIELVYRHDTAASA
ncbi:hypothetical protein [Polymorphobacter fuscus]|uniref:Uncharacterized protein n=1 Tax=Sandarakinorhabdus fusca TaxID=1439888 RepID=A0A7C9KYR4_9SPHN|nr:hypothetical protein [Polymorphobacter fuscus]KAB7643923.1 hypothetical protein F9290_15340 [Polymorphobacter fuscus]MQT18626.1 hypothetical protein [Polymorphobacter fuscus]NJC07006.1 hypothetical protein [Polymorphobacter fuscus]